MAKKAEISNENATKEAQKTAPKAQETPPKADTETPPEAPETPPEAEETREQYAFPRENPCPRCQALDTVATSTQGQIQYRHCTRAICRENFKVIGQKIVFTDCKQDD